MQLKYSSSSGIHIITCALAFAVSVLLPKYSGASCYDPTYCYCGLEPVADGEVLVRAEVLRKGDSTADIRVLGVPFHDPEDMVASGQVFEALTGYTADIAVGDAGVFLLRPTGNSIRFYVIEEGGRYLCFTDPDFPGLNMNELAQLVLSGDCRENARELGIDADCDPVVSGCCGNDVIMYYQPAALLLVLGVIRPRKTRGK